MKRTELMNEYEVILAETILLHDVLALENINMHTDPTTNPEFECRCRRRCGKTSCDRLTGPRHNEDRNPPGC